MNKKAICWFSAGVTSTIAIKMVLKLYDEVEIYYFDTGQVHPDNKRFIKECQDWYNHPIITLKSDKYTDPLDVIRKIRYVNGPAGARCTLELKKELRFAIEKQKGASMSEWDQIFGFEYDKKEVNRAIRFKEQYPNTNPVFPLITQKLTKENCLGILENAGIRKPTMYELGYRNNNCIGCVKGGQKYWNKIRVDFPEIFEATAKLEREVGASCLRSKKNGISKRLFLDELDPEAGRNIKEVMPQCGVICQTEFNDLISDKTDKVMTGELRIEDIGEDDDEGCGDGI